MSEKATAVKKTHAKSNNKPWIIAVISLAVLLVTAVGVYAWFTNQKSLATITRVNAPMALSIGAGAKEDSKYIDMGGIDVSGETKKKDFVFCVYSDETVGNYKIQLAHTTNIPFDYTVYKATESNENGDVLYVDKSNTNHYYTKGAEISGAYLNQKEADKIANDTLHDKSYGTYSSVQKNAEPLYWQSGSIAPLQPTETNTGFVDYYILEVSSEENVPADKETDIVYITAGIVSGGTNT